MTSRQQEPSGDVTDEDDKDSKVSQETPARLLVRDPTAPELRTGPAEQCRFLGVLQR